MRRSRGAWLAMVWLLGACGDAGPAASDSQAATGGDTSSTGVTEDTTEAPPTTGDTTGTAEGSASLTDGETGTVPTTGETGGVPTTGTTTGTTGSPACGEVADCNSDECRVAVDCVGGECVFMDMPAGTALSEQTPGDCALMVCDGQGGVTAEPDAGDLPDDGVTCTEDACDGVTPVHTPLQQPCYDGPDGTLGVGACAAGVRTCDVELGDFGACEGQVVPLDEDCDVGHLDEDCDGMVDESGLACVCGDGVVSNAEACDDGNLLDDACSSACEPQAVLQVAHNGGNGCARLTGGLVKCWGLNNFGQLGLGDTQNRGAGPGEMGAALPVVDLGAGQLVTALAINNGNTCGLLADGRVKCWGHNLFGSLGLGDTSSRGDQPGEMGDALPFVDLGQGLTATALSGESRSFCALLADGGVKCWGLNQFGALGLGDTQHRGDGPNEMGDKLPRVDLGQGATAVAIGVGQDHACAVLTGGAVKCWGYNVGGRLGLGDTANRGDQPGEMGDALPVVALAGPAVAVTAGIAYTCALLGDGRVQCWGGNAGYLGLGDMASRGDQPGEMGPNLPAVDLGAGKLAVAVNAGHTKTCALLDDATMKCWGNNGSGVLGLGDTATRGDQPGEMGDDLPAIDLGAGLAPQSLGESATGNVDACVVLSDGSAKCWGTNLIGELGLGDTVVRGDMPGEMGDALPRIKLFSDVW